MSERELLGLMAAVLAAGCNASNIQWNATSMVIDAQGILESVDAREAARRTPPHASNAPMKAPDV